MRPSSSVSTTRVIGGMSISRASAIGSQVSSIIDEVEHKLKEAGATLTRREGQAEGRWVLLDYNDVVVHVQNKEERVFYSLERIWKDCPLIALPEAVFAVSATAGDQR